MVLEVDVADVVVEDDEEVVEDVEVLEVVVEEDEVVVVVVSAVGSEKESQR